LLNFEQLRINYKGFRFLVTFTYIPHSREILPAKLNPALQKPAGKGLDIKKDYNQFIYTHVMLRVKGIN